MARPRERYRLWKKDKKTYYYKLPGQGWKSTGHSKKTDAKNFADDRYGEWLESPAAVSWLPSTGNTLRDFIAPYYKWEECPRIADRLLERKRISKQHAKHQRALINNYILKDEIAEAEASGAQADHYVELARGELASAKELRDQDNQ